MRFLTLRDLKQASTRDQEEALLELIATGDRLGAVSVIKLLYGYDTTRAMQFLKELSETDRFKSR